MYPQFIFIDNIFIYLSFCKESPPHSPPPQSVYENNTDELEEEIEDTTNANRDDVESFQVVTNEKYVVWLCYGSLTYSYEVGVSFAEKMTKLLRKNY